MHRLVLRSHEQRPLLRSAIGRLLKEVTCPVTGGPKRDTGPVRRPRRGSVISGIERQTGRRPAGDLNEPQVPLVFSFVAKHGDLPTVGRKSGSRKKRALR